MHATSHCVYACAPAYVCVRVRGHVCVCKTGMLQVDLTTGQASIVIALHRTQPHAAADSPRTTAADEAPRTMPTAAADGLGSSEALERRSDGWQDPSVREEPSKVPSAVPSAAPSERRPSRAPPGMHPPAGLPPGFGQKKSSPAMPTGPAMPTAPAPPPSDSRAAALLDAGVAAVVAGAKMMLCHPSGWRKHFR